MSFGHFPPCARAHHTTASTMDLFSKRAIAEAAEADRSSSLPAAAAAAATVVKTAPKTAAKPAAAAAKASKIAKKQGAKKG